ncbi:GNAT family N-acetyltransferase [Sphingosinicella terrae]|uniref:GNAT family N-acetyltransferase n=1 Tax=Sphingosinicella terrae TaxID=2172047 RepID=UPI000E0CF5D4|nr:GNAT family N-acetyltransferase [Sphingosinicella terrae]
MTDADLPFVEALYASTREEELAATGWPAEMRRAFLTHQHDAQHRHYRAHYEGAEWLILERDGEPLGRLYLVEWSREFRIIDISLLPRARGRGLGGALLTDILAAAAAAGKRVSIHVDVHNPARRLYERLGFTVAEDKGIHLLMEWAPAATDRTA